MELRAPHAGARDSSPARDDVAISIDHRLYFSGHSTLWGGAAAFLDTVPIADQASQRALGRAYLISWDQFEDVVAEENGRPTAPLVIADAELVDSFTRLVGPGRYENLLCLGRRGDIPMVTFTAPWAMAAVRSAAPSRAYLATLAEGLRERARPGRPRDPGLPRSRPWLSPPIGPTRTRPAGRTWGTGR